MSIVYRIDKEIGATFVLWEGIVTADDFLAHIRRLTSDPEWPPPKRLHLSMLHTATLDPSMDDGMVERAVDLYGKHQSKLADMRAAIVAGDAFKSAVIFERGIARHGASVIVFNSLDVASTWLGIGVGDVERTLQLLSAQ
jgi:hypothetical protein